MKQLQLTLLALLLSFASFALAPITGTLTVCQFSTTTLSDATAGGTWSSSAPAIASVSSTGVVTGNAAGTANVSYFDGASTAMVTVTVNPVPASITGTTNICVGASTTLASTTIDGTWSSTNSAVASIGGASGTAVGLASGTTTISYTLASGCASTTMLTVLSTPTIITGPADVCTGASITLVNGVSGGAWTSADADVSVDVSSGLITGVTVGTAEITYILSTGCSTTTTVNIIPSPSAIVGATSICTGSTVTLSSTPLGGTWTSSSPTVADADPATGAVFGASPGLAIIFYTVPNGCVATTLVTVSSTPSAGPITGPMVVCTSNTIALSGFTPGGTWSSSNPAKGSINTTTGVLTGLTVGSTTVTYTLSSFCGSDVATAVITVDTISTAGTLSGPAHVCIGSNIFVSSTVAGGTWSSGDPSIATVSSIGSVTGLSEGVVDITYTVTLACGTAHAVKSVTVNPLYTITITGTSSICIGSTTTLNALPPSGPYVPGTWSTSSSILSVSSVGEVTGIAAGAAAVSFTSVDGCVSVTMITVLPPPNAGFLSGPTSVCPGSTITISSTVSGGTWSALNPNATVDPSTGVVTGVSPGVDTIVYSTSSGCGVAMAMWGVTVSATPSAGSITGSGSVCIGLTTPLSDLITGGTWLSSSPGVATIGATSGIVSGVSLGTSIITYTVVTGCGTVYTNTVVTVTPTAGTVTGSSGMCIGATAGLIAPLPGGVWSSGLTTIATVNATTGVVTGIAAGTAMITYSLPGGCATIKMVTVYPNAPITVTSTPASCGGLYNVVASGGVSYTWSPATGVACTNCGSTTINPSTIGSYVVSGVDVHGCPGSATAAVNINRIYGHIYYPGVVPAVMDTKVWITRYNTGDSSATADSSNMITCMDGGVPYYEFTGKTTGNYMVRAKLVSSVPGTSDYIPTYGSSSPSWYNATSVVHGGGSDVMDITMLYATVPSGPGFISGHVYVGTSGLAPAAGMLVYLRNPFTWDVLSYTYTDAAGAYSFNSIATGSYIVFPEDYDNYTTPSAFVNISGTVTSVTNVNFRKNTSQRTIKPLSSSDVQVVDNTSGISTYPNPTSGMLNIEWNGQATGIAEFTVTDMLGRTVYTSTIDINAQAGKASADLSSLNRGVYLVNIKSANLKYNTRLVIQ